MSRGASDPPVMRRAVEKQVRPIIEGDISGLFAADALIAHGLRVSVY